MISRISIGTLILCSLFVVGIIGYNDFRKFNQLYFVVEMESSRKGASQLFYDVGHGYNEQDSYIIQLYKKTSKKCIFPLRAIEIKSIRLDPINVSAVVRIKDAQVENKRGDVIKKFSFRDFKPVQQIDRMDIRNGTLTIYTAENADDPIIQLENSSIKSQGRWTDYIAKRGLILIGYGIFSLLVLLSLYNFLIFAARNKYIVKAARHLKIYISKNPKKSIAFFCLIAAIASCYPVVFFGKSFVSPIGVAGLYPYPPFVPGFPLDVTSENFRGSDVGAMAWSVVPNTVVQHEALMRHFEFPFWIRYVGGGTPLFAQGQSMIGDILHWIPIVLNGSAVGWDVKFVLSKIVFAMGMGLLIFQLTRNFMSASLIAISSCFLGFFAYRFNHPAFFVLTYAPWIVLQWDRLGVLLASPRPIIKKCVIGGLLLAAVAWLQLNAGALKEGVITAFFMHAMGMIIFIDHLRHRRGLIQSFFIATGFGFAIVMISSPYWLLFLDALSKSFTYYDNPGVNTFPMWKILGFFDNFFFQEIDGTLGAPSTNIFVLLCLTSAIVSLRWYKSVQLSATILLFFLALFVAYGAVPKFILLKIPFINKIQHVFNTFSVPMMILALVLAGFGIQRYFDISKNRKKMILALSLSTLLGLWLVYFLMTHNGMTFLFFMAVIAVVFVGFWQLYQQTWSGAWSRRNLIILTCCFLLLHARHGMQLMTGIEEIDAYMQNPTKRANFSNKSAAIEFFKNRIMGKKMPVRVIGEGSVMFPGYNSMFGLEGIVSVEPLRNEQYEKLLSMIDYPEKDHGWLRLINSNQLASRAASLDLLGVGYIVAAPGTRMPRGVKLIHSSDLDIWERETVWPRAFFVNRVLEIHEPSDILAILTNFPHAPFAAVESQLIPLGMPKNINTVSQVLPAKQYTLTNNSTQFSVDATGCGLIVLGETYYPEDFVANLNGKRVDYIRVNQAFKGIWVQEAGRYDVSFTYRPARIYHAIIISSCGALLLLMLSALASGSGHLKSEKKYEIGK